MQINRQQNGSSLVLEVEGRLDTTTAPQLEEEVRSGFDGITEVVFKFDKLEYVSSAGLRVLLLAQKIMNKKGKMTIKGANEDIKEVFDMTGFSDILTVED